MAWYHTSTAVFLRARGDNVATREVTVRTLEELMAIGREYRGKMVRVVSATSGVLEGRCLGTTAEPVNPSFAGVPVVSFGTGHLVLTTNGGMSSQNIAYNNLRSIEVIT